MNINITIKIPKFIESVILYFVLCYRKKKYGYPFRKIQLTQGLFAIVDVEDFQKLNQYKWFARIDQHTHYAARIKNRKKIYMHRQIMRPPLGFIVDHKNHKGFDNRKENLRIATQAENVYNSRKTAKNTTSVFKGVSKCKKTGKWRAVICVNGLDMHLGYFDNEIEAAKTYDKAAKIYHGQFATLNFSDQIDTANRKLFRNQLICN